MAEWRVAPVVMIVLLLSGVVLADAPVASGGGRAMRFDMADGTVITGRCDGEAIAIRVAQGDVLTVPIVELTGLTVGGSDVPEAKAKPGERQGTVRAGGMTLVGTITVKQFQITSLYGHISANLSQVRRIRPVALHVVAQADPVDMWVVTLRDKSRLKCTAASPLRVQTPYGAVVVPLVQIQQARFSATGKSVRIVCHNSDRFIGTLPPKATISLKTDKGQVVLAAEKIAIVNHSSVMLDLKLGKGITMTLIRIPAGTFTMGSPVTEKGRKSNEGPQREVTISKPFYLGVTEVTQAHWKAIMDTDPSHCKGANRPVERVSWDDAVACCKALSKKTGRTVRLPTEAEWEYACRAGTTTPFHTGQTISTDQANYNARHTYGNGRKGVVHDKTLAVGSFKPNAFGLHDMHGNVLEWCADWYGEKYYAQADTCNPKGPASGSYRIFRGGSWSNYPTTCRAAFRSWLTQNLCNDNNGFRVVVESGSRR